MGSESVEVSWRYRLLHTVAGALVIVFIAAVGGGWLWAVSTSGSVAEGIASALILAGVVVLAVAIFNIGAPGADVVSNAEVAAFVPADEERPFQLGGARRREASAKSRTWLWLLGGAVGYFAVAAVLLRF